MSSVAGGHSSVRPRGRSPRPGRRLSSPQRGDMLELVNETVEEGANVEALYDTLASLLAASYRRRHLVNDSA